MAFGLGGKGDLRIVARFPYGVFFAEVSVMPVATCTTNRENEVIAAGFVVLTWQMAGAWIPAYAGMTIGVALAVKGREEIQALPLKAAG